MALLDYAVQKGATMEPIYQTSIYYELKIIGKNRNYLLTSYRYWIFDCREALLKIK